jgi:hypothetical protein
MNLNLENLKAGDNVAIVFVDPSRNRDNAKYCGPKKVVSDEKGNLRTISLAGEIVPKDGKGYYFMSKRLKPDYFFSANPVHIRAALKERNKRIAAQKKKEQISAEKSAIFSPLLEIYRDNEENNEFCYLEPSLLQRLTIKQLKTLATWINGKN